MAVVCHCGGESGVLDSRVIGNTKRRRRVCQSCGSRWTTKEVVVGPATCVANSGVIRQNPAETGSRVVRFFFDEKIRRNVPMVEIERRSGVNQRTMQEWRRNPNPRLMMFEAALGAMGYELIVRKIK